MEKEEYPLTNFKMPTATAKTFLKEIIEEAISKNASDIVLSFDCLPALKFEGKMIELEKYSKLSDSVLEALVGEIIPAGKKATLQTERQADFAYSNTARFRVNVFYQQGHLSIVMRYIQERVRTMEDLKLPDVIKDLVANDNGLLLVVGPTGSGKSTTLAAMIEHLNTTTEKHIITVEDPVEYLYKSDKCIIDQREIGSDAVDFPSALRSALREAPDVVLLGEMRDLESISTAITIAETGHLVLSTIHASSSVGSIDRIIDIFPEGSKDQVRIQLADVLIGVINQRLVPTIDGGVKLITEIMVANSAIKNAIRTSNSAQIPSVIQNSSSEGMHLLDDLLIKQVNEGEISKDTALEYAQDRAVMRKELGVF